MNQKRVKPTTEEKKYSPIFFWKPQEENGWLSNWSPHTIQEKDQTFSTMEHYFMYHKAMLMKDEASAKRVLTTKTPQQAKAVGRSVMNWDEEKWAEHRDDIIFTGLSLKTRQHPEIQTLLRQLPPDQEFAEVSPYDRIWGIGCTKEDRRSLDPTKWPGQNLLGKAWKRVRASLD